MNNVLQKYLESRCGVIVSVLDAVVVSHPPNGTEELLRF